MQQKVKGIMRHFVIENPNILRTKRIRKTITPKYTGIIRFTD